VDHLRIWEEGGERGRNVRRYISARRGGKRRNRFKNLHFAQKKKKRGVEKSRNRAYIQTTRGRKKKGGERKKERDPDHLVVQRRSSLDQCHGKERKGEHAQKNRNANERRGEGGKKRDRSPSSPAEKNPLCFLLHGGKGKGRGEGEKQGCLSVKTKREKRKGKKSRSAATIKKKEKMPSRESRTMR